MTEPLRWPWKPVEITAEAVLQRLYDVANDLSGSIGDSDYAQGLRFSGLLVVNEIRRIQDILAAQADHHTDTATEAAAKQELT